VNTDVNARTEGSGLWEGFFGLLFSFPFWLKERGEKREVCFALWVDVM
jgi:hypothetical protein